MTERTVCLLPESDRHLVRIARARGLTPEEVIADATESYLRERGDLVLRIADARRAHEHANG